MATWTTLLGEVRAELEEATASIWADADLLSWANACIGEVARRVRPQVDEEYATGTAGSKSYDLPTRTLDVRTVRWSDDVLTKVDYEALVALTGSGTPTTYAVFNDAIYLYPTPSDAACPATIRILRYYEPAAMTAGTNTVPFSSVYDHLIKDYIKARANEQVSDFAAASYFRERYDRALADAEYDRIRRDDTDVVRFPGEAW